DLASLADTLSLAFAEPWSVSRIRTSLLESPDVSAVYVVTWQDLPVATASSQQLTAKYPGMGWVHWVGTHPNHTRRGLAAALIERVIDDFKSRGYRSAALWTDDFRLPAIRTYLRFGFLPSYDVEGEDHRDRWSAIFQSAMSRPASHHR
ncbi:MAG: GNAT family N-acetyltransferase, partial [Chloroflexota bacterium]|nr:GNAT family N-acetyltransferase [Chloroflexota bacterium]